MTFARGRSQRFAMKGEEKTEKSSTGWLFFSSHVRNSQLFCKRPPSHAGCATPSEPEEERQSRRRRCLSHNDDASGEEFQKHKTFQAEMFEVFWQKSECDHCGLECSGRIAQDEMTHMVGRPRGTRLRWTAAGPGVLMWNRPVGHPEQHEGVILEQK